MYTRTLRRTLADGEVRQTRHQQDETDRDVWHTPLSGPRDDFRRLTLETQTVKTSTRRVEERGSGGEDRGEDDGVDEVGENGDTESVHTDHIGAFGGSRCAGSDSAEQ